MSNKKIKTLKEVGIEIGQVVGKFINLPEGNSKQNIRLFENKIRIELENAYFKSVRGYNTRYKLKKDSANHYGEYIAYIILKQLEKGVCRSELAKADIKHPYTDKNILVEGVLSHFDLEEDEVFLPATVFEEEYIRSELSPNEYSHSNSKFTNVELLLKSFEYKLKKEGQENKIPKIRKAFFDMCAFDMIFANRDRDAEDFGFRINEKTGEIDFYPLFDNEQILGMQETEEEVSKHLSSDDAFKLFKTKVLTSYMGIPSQPILVPFATLLEYLLENYENEILSSIADISRYTVSDLQEIMNMCDGLSEGHKTLAIKIYTERLKDINKIIENFKQRKINNGFSQSD